MNSSPHTTQSAVTFGFLVFCRCSQLLCFFRHSAEHVRDTRRAGVKGAPHHSQSFSASGGLGTGVGFTAFLGALGSSARTSRWSGRTHALSVQIVLALTVLPGGIRPTSCSYTHRRAETCCFPSTAPIPYPSECRGPVHIQHPCPRSTDAYHSLIVFRVFSGGGTSGWRRCQL